MTPEEIKRSLQLVESMEDDIHQLKSEIHDFVVPYFHAYLNDVPPRATKPPTSFDIPEVQRGRNDTVRVEYWICGEVDYYELSVRWFKYSVEDFVKVATRWMNITRIRERREKSKQRYRQLKAQQEWKRKRYEELKAEFEG